MIIFHTTTDFTRRIIEIKNDESYIFPVTLMEQHYTRFYTNLILLHGTHFSVTKIILHRDIVKFNVIKYINQ